jgi:carbon storage regulator
MLLLSRKKKQSFIINGNIEITVLDIQGDKVSIGVSAPRELTILRKELLETKEANMAADLSSDRNKAANIIEAIKKQK